MAWKETNIMEQRKEFIKEYLQGMEDLKSLCKKYTNKADMDILDKIEWRKTVLQINNLMSKIYHENERELITISKDRAWDNINVAGLYCEASDIESALDYVEKATQDAIYYCNNMDKKAFHGYDISTTQNIIYARLFVKIGLLNQNLILLKLMRDLSNILMNLKLIRVQNKHFLRCHVTMKRGISPLFLFVKFTELYG